MQAYFSLSFPDFTFYVDLPSATHDVMYKQGMVQQSQQHNNSSSSNNSNNINGSSDTTTNQSRDVSIKRETQENLTKKYKWVVHK